MSKDHALHHAKPEKIGLNEQALARLGDTLQREIDSKRLPGAVALIARKGRIGYFESFGQRDPAQKDEMQKDSIFRIYSMTKPIVSTAIMMLVEEGRILLGDSVSRFIPAFGEMKVGVERDGELHLEAPIRPVSVQDLLRHTSGLTYDFTGMSAVQKLYAKANLARGDQTNADQVAALAKLPLLNQPGSTWDYSRSTDVLGRIVEIVTGQKLGDALQSRILDPLGMKDTGFSVPAKQQSRIAQPFAVDPDTNDSVRLLDATRSAMFESGGGGLMSTAMDYARFCAMHAGGGTLGKTQILSRKIHELMVSNHLDSNVRIGNADILPPGHGFGLGFAVRTSPGISAVPGSVGLYYWGGIAGTTFWIDPAEDLFALMLIQAPGQRDYYRMLFRTLVYAALE